MEAIKKVMRYLKTIKAYMLVFHKVKDLKFVGYMDSDIANYLNDQRSTSRYIFMLAGGVIF